MLDQFTADEMLGVIDGAGVGLWSWDVDADELRWTSQLGVVYGLDPKDYPDDMAAFSDLIPAPFGENIPASIHASMDEETGRFEFEHPIVRPSGGGGWVRNSGRVSFDDNHRAKSVAAIVVDITTRKQAELSLQNREEQFRRFSELTSDFIYDVDMTVEPFVPNVAAGSYERVVGYTKAELAAKGGWPTIMNPDDLANRWKVFEQLQSGIPTVHEYRILNKHGETRWLRDYASSVLEDDKLVRLVGGVKDITETKVLQDQLLQAQKHEAMAQLAGAVAHDFNNLLFVVMASAELITSGSRKRDIADLTSDIFVLCERAAELTRSLLAFTRKDMPQTQTVRLSDVVHDLSGILQRAVGEQIDLRINCLDSSNDNVDIDPGHLQLVLLNLATNARAAMRDRGVLRVSVSWVDLDTVDLPHMTSETVLLEVTDTGCGIAEEHLSRVFEPFFTTKPAGEGSGIGLASCWQIIEQAGGTIQVESDPGHGTTFSIYLPTVDKAVHKEVEPTGNFSFGGKERILIVEDDAVVRRVSDRVLKSYGYSVSSVGCVEAARHAMADEEFDLLVVDVRLPDGDGCNLVSELQKADPELAALLVSGYVDDGTRTKIHAAGHIVLPKPYTAAALARSVRTTIQNS